GNAVVRSHRPCSERATAGAGYIARAEGFGTTRVTILLVGVNSSSQIKVRLDRVLRASPVDLQHLVLGVSRVVDVGQHVATNVVETGCQRARWIGVLNTLIASIKFQVAKV